MTHQAQDEWAKRNGLRPSKAHACPKRVAGVRCNGLPNEVGASNCMHRDYSVLHDHARMWLDGNGAYVLTTETYSFSEDRFRAAQAHLSALGLTAVVADESPWYPGNTTMIIIRSS
jgi:hypothetical protein